MVRKGDFEEAAANPLFSELTRTRQVLLHGSEHAMAGTAARAAGAVATIAFWLWLLAGGELEKAGLPSVPSALLAALAYVSGAFLAVLLAPRSTALLQAVVARKTEELEQLQRERCARLAALVETAQAAANGQSLAE